MPRKFKLIISVILIYCFSMFSVTAYAAGPEITPRFNNTTSTSTGFNISSTGYATVSIGLYGINGTTTGATIKTYIEKKMLGLFWVKVSNGQSNNEWVDVVSGTNFSKTHSVQLSGSGEYRAVVTYTIRGYGGADDVVPATIYRSY